MIKLKIILLSVKLLIFFIEAPFTVNANQCYNPKNNFYPYTGKTTAYEYVHGFIEPPKSVSQCEPIQIWVLARHGTRYPEKKVTKKYLNATKIRDDIIKNHQEGRGKLCSTDLDNLSKWTPDPGLNISTSNTLTIQGYVDHEELAKRLKNVYPTLLKNDPENINPGDYVFRSTHSKRVINSMNAFAKGLFNESYKITPDKTPEKDHVLSFHTDCKSWINSDNDNSVNEERDRFEQGFEVQKITKNISERLGFNHTVNYDMIMTMYEACRFEMSWYLNQTTPWCTLFTKEEMKLFEFADDLGRYYYDGPARSISLKLGCQTFKNMYERFETLNSGNLTNQPKGVFLFSHQQALQTLMSIFEIGKESKPLSAKNYNNSDNRVFRTSLLGSFASNFVAVFYRCDNSQANKVTFYVSEKPVLLSGCKKELCDWSFIQKKFGQHAKQCREDDCDQLSF